MRIAVLGIKALPATAGADRVVERLLEHSAGAHEYTIYLLRDARPALESTRARHYIYIGSLSGKFLRPFTYFLLCSLHYLFKGDYDVAHVHNSDFGLFCLLLKLKRRVRVIGTFHGDPYARQKWGVVAKAFLHLSEWLFVRSCDVLTSVASSKAVPGRTIHYIPNGVDPWTPSDVASGFPYAAFGLQRGQYLMFACGRLDGTKGLHHLLRAHRQLPQAETLLVVGDFSHDANYTKSIERMASEDPRVILYRHLLPKGTLLEVVHRCSVFVFPSEVEAMSMMLLEAIACQVPIVCSDIPENVAVVGTAYPFLFRSGDVESLREVLRGALVSTPNADDMRAMFQGVTARFRWDSIAAEYENLYESD